MTSETDRRRRLYIVLLLAFGLAALFVFRMYIYTLLLAKGNDAVKSNLMMFFISGGEKSLTSSVLKQICKSLDDNDAPVASSADILIYRNRQKWPLFIRNLVERASTLSTDSPTTNSLRLLLDIRDFALENGGYNTFVNEVRNTKHDKRQVEFLDSLIVPPRNAGKSKVQNLSRRTDTGGEGDR